MTVRLIVRLLVAPAVLCLIAAGAADAAQSPSLPRLKAAENKRFFADESGRPFFWLADTAWQLLHDLDAEEQQRYFADRQQKGFNVVQTVILVELRDDRPNAFGHRPIEPRRPDRPIVGPGENDDYWDDIARSLSSAEKHGIYLALLPTWGKNVTSDWQNGLVNGFFTGENAEAYGRFLGTRFKDHSNIIWVLGGDRAAPTDQARAIWRSLARGIVLGLCGREDYSAALMTYHTSGPGSTAWFLNDEPWMDFHGLQSGHGRWVMNWIWVEHAYSMKPVMPVIDLETSYPELRHGRPPTVATDDDARRAAYWALFAGAAGHTYGHNSVWQMHSPKNPGVANVKRFWYDALDVPSARQMGHLRRLFESRPFATQRPAPELIAFEQDRPWEMCFALRGDGFAMIYTPTGRSLRINLPKLGVPRATAWWFDPRQGTAVRLGEVACDRQRDFDPPGDEQPGNDWVLVLDAPEKRFSPPGGLAAEAGQTAAQKPGS